LHCADCLLASRLGQQVGDDPRGQLRLVPAGRPRIVSIPLAFILGVLGTLTSKDGGDPEINAEMEVRSLTGFGAEKATHH